MINLDCKHVVPNYLIRMDLLDNINDKNGVKMITMFENNGSQHDYREYFTCYDIDYNTNHYSIILIIGHP